MVAPRKRRRSLAAATLLSASLLGPSSAFSPPPGQRRPPQCRPRNRRHRLFVQSKEGAKIAEGVKIGAERSDEGNDADDDDDILAAARELARSLEVLSGFGQEEPAALAGEETLAVSKIQPVPRAASLLPDDDASAVSEDGSEPDDGLFWRGVVVLLCALWASNFAFAKVVLAQPGVDAGLYAVARFSLAAASLLPGSVSAVRKGLISWDTARGALVCGSWVAFGYLGQIVGLMTTTPSRSCVICSLNCIFVAIVAEFMRVNATKERGYTTDFDWRKLAPALIAVAGVAIVELKGAAGGPTVGDLISFSQPIGFGMGYLQLEELMKKEPTAALPVSAIKLAVVATAALLFFEASPHATADLATSMDADAIVEGAKHSLLHLQLPDFTPILNSPFALGAIVYTGIVTTSLALWVESVAFQRVPATDASVILTTEPLFAAAISAALVGETFGPSDAVGSAFIVGACVYSVRMGTGREVCDETTRECRIVDE